MRDCGLEVLPKSPLESLVALLEVDRENVAVSTSGETVAELRGSAVAGRSGAGGGSGDGVAASGDAASGGEAASGEAASGGELTSRW